MTTESPRRTASRPLTRRLAVRMGVSLCLGAALILWGASSWNLRLQRRHLETLLGHSADNIAEYIRGATRDAMLRNDANQVHRIISDIASQPGIARIRVFNKEGRIRTSTQGTEVGALVDTKAEQCVACHSSGRPLEHLERRDRVRIFQDSSGARTLAIIAPIKNEPQCAGCHPRNQSVLGVLDVQLSMAGVDTSLEASERQMGWGLLATAAAVLALAGILVWRMVLSPVGHLATAIERAADGDLTSRIPVSSRDEIGQLADSWNRMSAELERSRGEIQQWNRTLEQRVAEKAQELKATHERMLVVEKMASLGKLAAVVAHEINNPLAGIRTYARLLRRQLGGVTAPEGSADAAAPPPPPSSAETDRILEVVEEEAARCGGIVRNLLLFGRSSAGKMTQEDLSPILERCRMLLQHQADILSVRLIVDCPSNLPRIVCDIGQVQQMVLALAMNALEATSQDGTVTIRARADGEEIVLLVQDTGHGIPQDLVVRIYEPFFTTKPEGKGVGLGLSVVYGIVHRHGGTIDVRSAPGEGTTFTVRLPLLPPRSEEVS